MITRNNKGQFMKNQEPPNKRDDVRNKAEEIIKMYRDDLILIKDIAKKFNCERHLIYSILKEKNSLIPYGKRRCLSYKKGTLDIWNKGLTMADERVLKNCLANKNWRNNNFTNKSYEEIYGEDRAREIKEKQGRIQSKLKMGNNNPMYGKIGVLNPKYGKEVSLETRKKSSASRQGISLEKWEKFISKEPYTLEFNKRLKNKIRERDNQICMNCGIHREKLNEALTIHHINYDKKLNIPQNLICLCRICHALTNYNREYWTKLFQEKLSKLYGYNYYNNEIMINLGDLK